MLLGLRYVDQRGDDVLKTAAAEALTKIGAVLISPEAQASLAVPLALPGPSPAAFPVNTTSLDDLRASIRTQTRLEIAYEDEQGRSCTRRIVWPIQLGFMDRARVLAAWCELRQDFRIVSHRPDRRTHATGSLSGPSRRPRPPPALPSGGQGRRSVILTETVRRRAYTFDHPFEGASHAQRHHQRSATRGRPPSRRLQRPRHRRVAGDVRP